MKVFKFGGASVKNAEAVRNVANIISGYTDNLVVVVSAMAKTTNALEKVVEAHYHQSGNAFELLQEVKNFHTDIMRDLFPDKNHAVYENVHNVFVEAEWMLEEAPPANYDFLYDQIVPVGELASTHIIAAYLQQTGIAAQWVDVRDFMQTDNTYRFARINWPLSEKLGRQRLLPLLQQAQQSVLVTQGFMGVTSENYITTLGREGSDFTAAILAYILDAENVTIWKDVPGVMNADPKRFPDAVLLPAISYREAIELTFYGATVIHPRTLKPLQNKNIPLLVKSFLNPTEPGTCIANSTGDDSIMPSFIYRDKQVLVSVSARDYSFIVEDNLSEIFAALASEGIKINVMQNSAMNFSFAADYDERKIAGLLSRLGNTYEVKYNQPLELLTIRHFTEEVVEKLTRGKILFMQQRTRATARFLMQDE